MKLKLSAVSGTLFLALAIAAQAADTVRYQAQPTGSQMKLDGDSSVHKWTCISKIVGGFFEVESAW